MPTGQDGVVPTRSEDGSAGDADYGLVRAVGRSPAVIETALGGIRTVLNVGYPSTEVVQDILGGTTKVTTVPIPIDCRDGFNEGCYARPERLFDLPARKACSGP